MTNSEITNENEWFLKLQAEAKKIGARVHLIEIKVDYSKSWHDTVTCGPQVDEVIILFNWKKNGGRFINAVKWAESNNLLTTDFSVIHAILTQKRNLNHELKSNKIKIIGTAKFDFEKEQYTNYTWYYPEQGYHMIMVNVIGDKNDWLAFRRKKIVPTPPEGTVAGEYDGC